MTTDVLYNSNYGTITMISSDSGDTKLKTTSDSQSKAAIARYIAIKKSELVDFKRRYVMQCHQREIQKMENVSILKLKKLQAEPLLGYFL